MKFNHSNTDDVIDALDFPRPYNSDPHLYDLLSVLTSEHRRIDLDAEQLYDQRFIETATSRELEKIAFEVGVQRRDGETDEHLRKRVYGAYIAQSSDATYDTFAEAIIQLLDASDGQFTIETPPTTAAKTVEITIDAAVIDASPLTNTEIESILEDIISVDGTVNLIVGGTFGFDGDPDNEGFNEGTWSGAVS